ncbi:MAG TPA: lysophospholipid acyltransferase family protein [Acetobacteraceae bacterium]|jgi:1-acyl-sn-glycerol-3-phosphate acyltransferase|nr:lysophospholipid acyltransferase family protein [Acetobacteraceae bacterium]
MSLLRSSLFNLWFYGATVCYALQGAGLRLLGDHAPAGWPERLVRRWSATVLAGLWPLVGIRYEVSGWEHLPAGPAVVASMHQSAFDTLVWLLLLRHPAYVLKRELTRIPVFGPMCTLTEMIAVDRGAGAAAIRALLRGGDRAVAAGRAIVIFPEGTRVAPGRRAPLHPGVAALATRTGVPVVPVVTDSGLCWGRRAFRKRPGVIHIVIRPALPPGLSRPEIMARLEAEFEQGAAALGTPWPAVDKSVGTGPAGLAS